MTLVLADGTVANAGGKVVKNVAGYDLGPRLRLAGPARAHRARELRCTRCPSRHDARRETDDAARCRRALRCSQLVPSALDVLHPGRVAVLFEGSEPAVEAQVERASASSAATSDSDGLGGARARQAAARGPSVRAGELRALLETTAEAVVRPAAGVAYTPSRRQWHVSADARAPAGRADHEQAFDPHGVLAG